MLAFCAAPILARWIPSVPVDTRSMDEIYAAARQEFESSGRVPLQVWSGGDAGEQGDTMRQAWKANFPDIALNFTVDLSKYHDTRVDRAYLFDNGSSVADVVLLQVLSDFPKWKAQGRLLQYKPPSYDDLLEEWKDQDGAYLPAYLRKSEHQLSCMRKDKLMARAISGLRTLLLRLLEMPSLNYPRLLRVSRRPPMAR